MPRLPFLAGLLLVAFLGSGCACFDRDTTDESPDKLLEWAVGKKDKKNGGDKKDKKDKNGNGDDKKDDDKNGDEKKENGAGKDEKKDSNGEKNGKDDKKNGNGDKNGKDDDKSDDDDDDDDKKKDDNDEIETDRPDFTNSPTTVGKGRVQLETGYSYYHDRSGNQRLQAHSYPEALLRVGMFADWFEWRFGISYVNQINTDVPTNAKIVGNGWEDAYLGCKIALTEQKGILPETGLTLQMTVPTGVSEYTAGQVLPGICFLYRWEIIENCLSLGGSTQANRAIGEPLPGLILQAFAPEEITTPGHPFLELAQSLSVGYTLTPKLGAFTEWFAFIPMAAIGADSTPENFFNGGFTYKIRPNLQWDIRAGVGLNNSADNLFAGSGLAVRY